jgi:hypothetical protein
LEQFHFHVNGMEKGPGLSIRVAVASDVRELEMREERCREKGLH